MLYEICSAQGYKNMVKSVLHAVRDLHAVYVTLISLDGSPQTKRWRTHYLLLLWLGVLLLNPFDMNSLVGGGWQRWLPELSNAVLKLSTNQVHLAKQLHSAFRRL